MDQKDMWQEMRRHVEAMARDLDAGLRKVPPFSVLARGGHPPVNVYEDEETLIVCAEVPGVPRERLAVSVRGRTLTLEGEEDRSRFASATCLVNERGEVKFRREVSLPDDVDADAEPTAALENGLLTVRLKRRALEKGKTVRVEGA